MSFAVRFGLATALCFVGACTTVPPNATEITIRTNPSAAAVFAGNGTLKGITPFSYLVELTPTQKSVDTSSIRVKVVWYSGASVVGDLNFNPRESAGRSIGFSIDRPDAPGVMQDIAFAEQRERQSDADSKEGWAVLAEAITVRRRQAAAPSSPSAIQVPDIMKPPLQCTSTSTYPNQVVTTCK